MTVEDRFPVGMRVLAVDDDPTCLKLLEKLLRQCDYHVTTTSEAIKALNLLRENKDKFDLVISDVHMPDMDGFKLLELVGLEMDLPVIMLSANSDTKAVMKGITHGACDYLLKPVRIEELKNIWQHVIRRRKVDSKDQNNAGHGDGDEKLHNGGQGPAANGKLAKKRKDQNEEDDDDCEENDHSNGDSSTQKKPRVVWSVELHRKFVAAVNQLGIDRAVPKRILDLMNVEKLSRENVASHLQKYRLYLKRISQHENIAAAFGGKDLSYLHMGSLDRLGDFHAAGPGQIPKTTFSSFQGSGALSRLNSPTGLGFCGLTSSGMIELGQAHNSSNLISDLGKLQHPPLIRNQNWNLLQRIPHSLDIDQLQQNKHVSLFGELSSSFKGSRGFPSGSQQLTSVVGSPDSRLGSGSCSTSYLNVTDNHSSLEGHQYRIICGGFGNQSSIGMASLNTEPFDIRGEVSSQLPEHGKSNDPWQSDASIFGHSMIPLSMGAPFSHNGLLSGRDSEGQHSLDGISLPCALGEREEKSRFSSFGNMGNNVGLNNNYTPKESGDHRLDFAHNPNVIMNSSMNPLFSNDVIVSTRIQSLSQSNGVASTKTDATLIGQPISVSPFYMQHSDESVTDSSMKVKEDYLIGHAKLQRGFNPSNCSPFDELMTAILKPVHEEVASMDGGGGFNAYPVRTCV